MSLNGHDIFLDHGLFMDMGPSAHTLEQLWSLALGPFVLRPNFLKGFSTFGEV
jgi:hypothetical protein